MPTERLTEFWIQLPTETLVVHAASQIDAVLRLEALRPGQSGAIVRIDRATWAESRQASA